jgi:Tol biopolymer transport system component
MKLKSAVGRLFRSPFFWVVFILMSGAVLHYFEEPTPVNESALHETAVKPPPSPKRMEKAPPVPGETAQPEVRAEQEVVPKVELKMGSRQSLTPREDYMAPRWSLDGLDVLVTKGKYRGLYLVSSNGEDLRQISDEPGVGYHARWSSDGNYIIVEGEDGVGYYDRSGQEVDPEQVRAEAGPSIYAKDGVVYRRDGEGRSEADDVVMMDEDQYFEPVASPDGTKVAYIGLESGIVIKDLETEEDVYIGLGTDICWLPDGRGIIYNYTQDDGKEIIDGEIYFASADGSKIENLTNTADAIERHPNLSRDGSQLTYDVDGEIYTVEVEVE